MNASLATVFFTDIVSSTAQLGAAGDSHWRRQLDVHDNDRRRGCWRSTAADG